MWKKMASEITLYDYFCGELFRHGVIMWRLNDEFNQTVVMNDYDSNSGNMKDFMIQITIA